MAFKLIINLQFHPYFKTLWRHTIPLKYFCWMKNSENKTCVDILNVTDKTCVDILIVTDWLRPQQIDQLFVGFIAPFVFQNAKKRYFLFNVEIAPRISLRTHIF